MSVQCLQMAQVKVRFRTFVNMAMKIRDRRKIVEKMNTVLACEEKLSSCGYFISNIFLNFLLPKLNFYHTNK
jgi:hypothetical protein